MKSHAFIDPVYGSRIVLLWNGTPQQFSRHICNRYAENYDGDSDFIGRCIEVLSDNEPHHTVIIMLPNWNRSAESISTLAHEAWHGSEYILRFRDIEHSEHTSEVYAYLLDSIIRRCLKILP